MKHTEEPHQLTLTRYRDKDGKPTCATDFPCGKVCMFYRTSHFGQNETCVFDTSDRQSGMTRRNDGIGSLIPLTTCPVWAGEAKDVE
jgi:hypothetical protein